jgi:hypothetical protein
LTLLGSGGRCSATVGDAGDPVLDGLFVEAAEIIVAKPILNVFDDRDDWDRRDFELGIEAGDAAAVLRRCGVLARDIARIGQVWIGGARFGQSELVLPAIAEVVDVGQLRRAGPKQGMEGQLGSSAAANALVVDGKPPQMRVLPIPWRPERRHGVL